MMSPELVIGIIGAIIVSITFLTIVFRRFPKKLKTDKFLSQWKDLQRFCADKSTWSVAITEADKLFDKALRNRKYKGNSMGERMVAAQRILTDTDGIWFAHNLSKKLIADPTLKVKEADVKSALVSFRLALRDIGALPNSKTEEKTSASQ